MKELYSGNLYWPEQPSPFAAAEQLQSSIMTDCAVVGGGISGTLCSLYLARSGLSTVLLERGKIAGGSTAASTSLIQYCNDIMLCDLIGQIGERQAVMFYQACAQAVEDLDSLVQSLPFPVEFTRRSSLYFTSTEQELPKLRREYESLCSAGLQASFWESSDIAAHFPFHKPGAIVTHGDAEGNPVQMVRAIAEAGRRAGVQLYEHTDITRHEALKDGRYLLHTANGSTITAQHIIYAIGYEPEQLRGQLVKSHIIRSFAAATTVEPKLDDYWHERMLIWETSRPYLYMRTTADGRILIGGLDEDKGRPMSSPHKHEKHVARLEQRLQRLFPMFQARIEYEWSGVFGESLDNLPFIGADPYEKGIYYCLGYGGNGTVYSVLGAQLIADLIQGRSNPLQAIIGLERAMSAPRH